MDRQQFQETARRLAKGMAEGDWRSAISRSYYFLFHFFREFCLAHGLNLGQGGQAHNNVYVGLNNCGNRQLQPIADRVKVLRDERIGSDYNLAAAVRQNQAASAVAEADAIVADFQALLGTISGAQIVAGAKQYLQSIGRIPKTP